VFRLEGLTLRKGERTSVAIAKTTLDYEDVYVLDIPFSPPPGALSRFNQNQQIEIAKAFHAPKAEHRIRLNNSQQAPITTAPALLLLNGRVVAQGMTRYTNPGGSCEVALTKAIGIVVKSKDKELKRTPMGLSLHGRWYQRVDSQSTIALTNHGSRAVKLEMRRKILGTIDKVSDGGENARMHLWDDWGEFPRWWGWYSWGYWTYHLNSVDQATWKATLPPGESLIRTLSWHHFWP
jgi:hypothetical protein